jgi:hypothetical protein
VGAGTRGLRESATSLLCLLNSAGSAVARGLSVALTLGLHTNKVETTQGEDPIHMAELVTEFVTGAQNNPVGESVGTSGYLQAGTCCKVCRSSDKFAIHIAPALCASPSRSHHAVRSTLRRTISRTFRLPARLLMPSCTLGICGKRAYPQQICEPRIRVWLAMIWFSIGRLAATNHT